MSSVAGTVLEMRDVQDGIVSVLHGVIADWEKQGKQVKEGEQPWQCCEIPSMTQV